MKNLFPFISFLIFILILAGRIIFLSLKKIRIRSQQHGKKNRMVFLYPVFLLIAFLWMFEITKSAFQISFSILPNAYTNTLSKSEILPFSGMILVVISFLILLFSLIHFRYSFRFGLDEKNHGELITTGIFSITRNPFFLSIDIYFLGIALIFANPFFIGFAVLGMISIHFYILKEEKFMLKVYGVAYENYRKSVKRYICF